MAVGYWSQHMSCVQLKHVMNMLMEASLGDDAPGLNPKWCRILAETIRAILPDLEPDPEQR